MAAPPLSPFDVFDESQKREAAHLEMLAQLVADNRASFLDDSEYLLVQIWREGAWRWQ